MTKFDDKYIELCKRILKEGCEVENRTGINTIKVPEHYFNFNLDNEFPILQSKQTFYKQAIIEMLWIWQMQSNDVRKLQERGVKIWNEWMIDEDGIYRIYEQGTKSTYDEDKEVTVYDPLSIPIDNPNAQMKPKILPNGTIMKAKSLIPGKNIKTAKYYGKKYAYTIGTAYGYITNRYKHTQNLINTLKNNPTDRRLVKSLWQDEFLKTAVLPSCVWSTEWDVTNNKLNLMVHQRSCDVPLGLPFNVTQYATLLSLIAKVTNLEPGTIGYSIKDAHIYINQLEGIKEQIKRWDYYTHLRSLKKEELSKEYKSICNEYLYYKNLHDNNKKNTDLTQSFEEISKKLEMMEFILEPEKPEIWLNPDIDDFFKFDNSKNLKDIKIKKYRHLGKISFPIAQ